MYLKELTYVNSDLPSGWQPYYIYIIFIDNVEIGKIVLREGNNQQRYFDGHIGYTIEKPYQGHGYAYQASLLIKDIAIKKGFKELIFTCSPDNIASKKTIQKLQCQYLETKEIPKKLRKDFTDKETIKEIYIMKLSEVI